MPVVNGDACDRVTERSYLGATAVATAVGVVVRAAPVITASFPLHDGGLLFAMAGDLRSNGFALPAFTSYNGGGIPFAYPPLSLYLAAALSGLGIGLEVVLQWVPLLLSAASIPLVYLVLRRLLSPAHGVAGAFAFALMPSSYTWLIVGGGLTRSLGLVLALVTVHEALRLVAGQPRWRGAAAGVAGGLTALAHPYAAAFAVLSVLLILAWRARGPAAWAAIGVAFSAAVLVVLPWAAVIVSTHGWGSVLAAGGSRTQGGVSVASLLFEDITGATFSIFLGIALVGFAVEVARRRYFVPLWLVLTFVVLAGAGWIMPMLPISALMSVALVEVAWPAFERLGITSGGRLRAMATLLTAGLIASMGAGYVILTPLYPLSGEQRQAMAWVAAETPDDSTFAVLTGQQRWALDTASEWFPALTRRVSLGTAQGYEWTDAWEARVTEATNLQACAAEATVACVRSWVDEARMTPDFLYVAKGPQLGPRSPQDCCAVLRSALADEFETVYDGPGATIFAWSEASSAAPAASSVTSYTNSRGRASTAATDAASTAWRRRATKTPSRATNTARPYSTGDTPSNDGAAPDSTPARVIPIR